MRATRSKIVSGVELEEYLNKMEEAGWAVRSVVPASAQGYMGGTYTRFVVICEQTA